ncbi:MULTISPECIES: translation initiation factor IF-2 [unclassified Thermoactinomyces]|jgi:translation initiation factor IF-2|uniref:translation initiation factor IF-2 n=1 Tax=unclassified Thermoactinomyces TaxID=2634588 RepID=UPI0018DE3010|nr:MULTISPECIES: translation initiation factor IF-2 [unclassified Thermoactinomyces]MBH8598242.1 translation initiation factor IF-2 [Thermoactinomyces sp. CICC 10523]MBH8608520.1 translation initiation factor IF-2 [Thermoactinomyces sp. CICC 10521]
MRVYEYAKKMKISSKEMLNLLEQVGMKVNNHMSVLDEGMIQKVEQHMNKEGGAPSEAKEKAQGEKKVKQQAKNQNQSGSRSQRPSGNKRNSRPNRPNQRQNQPKSPGRQPRISAAEEVQKSAGFMAKDKVEQPKRAKKEDPKKGRFSKLKDDPPKDFAIGRGKGRNRKKGDRKGENREKQAPVLPKEITVSGPLTVADFAKLLRREASAVIKKLISHGVMATINQEIDVETMSVIAEEFDVTVIYKEEVDESNFEEQEEVDAPEDLVERPPVVTIMGHVDHGKTTLLDQIRNSNVTAGEAGGITQHIGAYQVEVNGKKITFLDTPGHAAFTTMRARGAQVTDITILVVAADDGVMPQTIEAVNHAKAANVPIIVAVNKMDKPGVNPDRVKQQLMEHGLVPEEWGGDTIFVPVSALTGNGIEDLLEMVLLVAEVQELKANPNKRARGVVIEAELDKGRGAVATVLVQNGTLKVGDGIVAGNYFGKIRAMINDRGRRIKTAPPSTPVEILGLPDVPSPGDQFMVFEDEKKGRAIAEKRMQKRIEEERGASSRVSLDDLFKQIKEGEVKDLNIIIKADVQGSAEALKSSLEKIDVEGVNVKIIHSGVGAISESDIILASASNAIVIGFNVRPEPNARSMAEQEKVDIRLHRVIYNVIEEIEAAMKGMLDPEFEEKVVGSAEVRQIFKVSKVGTIAGCYVIEGKIVRDGNARIIRDGVVIHDGKLDTLKRFKDDVKEVAQGYECGLTLQNYNDIKEGDLIEVYVIEEVERK